MKVFIKSYVEVSDVTIDEAITRALERVNNLDMTVQATQQEDVITKLYYILPNLGRIIVVVNDEDRDSLGVEDNILANSNISEYPIEKLPYEIVKYKELIIRKNSNIDVQKALDAAQFMANDIFTQVVPKNIPIVKIIFYNSDESSKLVMPSIFGDNIFLNISGIVNDGNAQAGDAIINKQQVTKEELIKMIGAGKDITNVDVSCITNMQGLFDKNSSFYTDDQKDTVTNFNQDISGWDVSNVTNMRSMFNGTKYFNQDISGWDVSNVTNIGFMFASTQNFNQNINGWDVSNVTDMAGVFAYATKFNLPLNEWNTKNVTTMRYMFRENSEFNQDISGWDVSNVTNHKDFTSVNSVLDADNQPNFK